jgi:uncharacterized protein
MRELIELRLKTNCGSCMNKCCSQPDDWVYLTARESSRLEIISGVSKEEFTAERENAKTGYVFRTLKLPCRFLDSQTGQCTVYEARPMACRLYPFHVDPFDGSATLYSSECGDNLLFPSLDSESAWRLMDFEEDVHQWVAEFWDGLMVTEQT